MAEAMTEFDLTSPAFRADPYPTYARMRRESPVCRLRIPGFGRPAWLVTRYDDVAAALKDPRLSSDIAKLRRENGTSRWVPRPFRILANSMVTTDDPDHARLKNLVHKGFTPARVEDMTARVQQITEQLLARLEERGGGVVDLIEEFALVLPMTVISEMLGVPVKERAKFRRFMLNLLDGPPSGFLRLVNGLYNNVRMIRYLDRLIELRRAEPDDGLITAMVSAEQSGDRLTQEELVGMVFLLLLAGHETTVNLIGNGMLALLDNREQLRLLQANPGFVKSTVEELLRYTNPVQHSVIRHAIEDMEIAGQRIAKSDRVILMLASANRDETVFENAELLDITRDPNRHMGFGLGIHFCLGAPLARMEGAIALVALVQRFPDIQLAISRDKVQWRPNSLLRGLARLPVRLGDARKEAALAA
ncbi:MAG TPA: cytochrome P450 [Alphaproteobacteria bacterium]|nr:cytochrome P450 [Alphaproteobacteria bacterium]